MSSPTLLTALYPDLLWHKDEFHSEWAQLMSEREILEVGPRSVVEESVAKRREAGEYITTRRLAGRALLPGFVNTHSHAFQRAVRGRTEYPWRSGSREESFWSWREIMYRAASELDPTDLEAVSQAVYVEMVKSGITRVGEFHYLHHRVDGTPYEDPDELTNRVLSAARSAGLSVTLLRSFYQRAGVGRPDPEGAQKIFCDPSLEYYLETIERLRSRGLSVGITPHSVRAVPKAQLEHLVAYANKHNLPFHIHVSEQQKEIEESLQEYGQRPVELLHSLGALGPRTTLVHAIHLTPREISLIGKTGCHIASCPTTERNLGDGIVPAADLLQAGAVFTFGTDSQCQICLPEDARQLEYHLRLQTERRSVLFKDARKAGIELLNMLTHNGASSLGIEKGGRLEPGACAQAIAVDLEHLSLAGSSRESLPLDIVFSAENSTVTDVWIDGQEVVSQGHHRAEAQARRNLERVMRKVRLAVS